MGKGRFYEKREHFFSQYYRAQCLRSRIKSRGYPGELKVKAIVSTRGTGKPAIAVPKELILSTIGEEPCWVKLEIKGRTIYKEYRPGRNEFHLPRGPQALARPEQKVEVKISHVTLQEFVQRAIKESPTLSVIQVNDGNYYLIVGNERIPLSLAMRLHFERGEKEPAAIFGITDYLGNMHGIKISHSGYRKPRIVFKRNIDEGNGKIAVDQYREIAGVAYDPKIGKLEVEYYDGRVVSTSTIWLKEPKYEKLAGIDMAFSGVSEDQESRVQAKGVVSRQSHAGIDWHSRADTRKQGDFGVDIERAVLEKLGIHVTTFDVSGSNNIRSNRLYNFDLTYFDKKHNFVAEEVKLITSERGYTRAYGNALKELPNRMVIWNGFPDDERRFKFDILPKIYDGHIVIISFNPSTGEFTRKSAGWVRLHQGSETEILKKEMVIE